MCVCVTYILILTAYSYSICGLPRNAWTNPNSLHQSRVLLCFSLLKSNMFILDWEIMVNPCKSTKSAHLTCPISPLLGFYTSPYDGCKMVIVISSISTFQSDVSPSSPECLCFSSFHAGIVQQFGSTSCFIVWRSNTWTSWARNKGSTNLPVGASGEFEPQHLS